MRRGGRVLDTGEGHGSAYAPSKGARMDKTILEIEKGEDLIKVLLKEFKGRQYVDARIFYMSETGEWMPTRKGLSMSPEIAGQVAGGIAKALEELGEAPAPARKSARKAPAGEAPDY
jgi:hypothetical protein